MTTIRHERHLADQAGRSLERPHSHARPFPRASATALAAASALLLVCCTSDNDVSLELHVRTDLVAGAEFDVCEVRADTATQALLASDSRDWFAEPARTTFAISQSQEAVEVEAVLLKRGHPLLRRRVLVRVRGRSAYEIVLTRNCHGITCEEGSCRHGVCVAEDCLDDDATCGGAPCESDAECPGSACAEPSCESGFCAYRAPSCRPNEYCSVERGCLPLEDALSPGVPDAGITLPDATQDAPTQDAPVDSSPDLPDTTTTCPEAICGPRAPVYLKPADTRPDLGFGGSLALSADGQWLAVASRNPSGTLSHVYSDIYLFTLVDGRWMPMGTLTPPFADRSEAFGSSMEFSADGRVLVVGARFDHSGEAGFAPPHNADALQSGAAYVYERSGNTFAEPLYIKSINPDGGDYFGSDVAISGDGNTIAIGAPREDSGGTTIGADPLDNGGQNSGAVYAYRREAGNWSEPTYIKVVPERSQQELGGSLALNHDGTTLLVAADFVFYHFEWDGNWRQASMFPNASGTNHATGPDRFDISHDGSRLVEVANVLGRQLCTYDFQEGTGFVAGPCTSLDDSSSASSVSLSPDGIHCLVGAPTTAGRGAGVDPEPDELWPRAGAAHFYRIDTDSIAREHVIKASNPDAGDQFGAAVALSDELLIMGAPEEASGARDIDGEQLDASAPGAGAVYVYERSRLAESM